MAAPLDDFSQLVRTLASPDLWLQAAVVGACVAGAWFVTRTWFRRDPDAPRRVWSSHKPLNSLMFPVLALVMVLLATEVLDDQVPMPLMRVVVPVLASLAVIRLVARALRAALPDSKLFRTVERSFSWLVWGFMVLWVTGVAPMLLRKAEQITWTLGGSTVSLRSLLEATVSAVAVLVAVLWFSALVESRLLAKVEGGDLSLRKIATNATRAFLLVVGTLLALTAAGIPLGALSVLGGAIGVGIGFGLQKLASNYVSGFVILAERSLRIGDRVKVDGFEGRITDIKTRYTVVRAADGRESLVPNEMLITQRVENHSHADRQVSLSTTVKVPRSCDLDRLMPEVARAVAAVRGVSSDPAPTVRLREFADDRLVLEIGFRAFGQEDGQGAVVGEVNFAVLRALRSLGVEKA